MKLVHEDELSEEIYEYSQNGTKPIYIKSFCGECFAISEEPITLTEVELERLDDETNSEEDED